MKHKPPPKRENIAEQIDSVFANLIEATERQRLALMALRKLIFRAASSPLGDDDSARIISSDRPRIEGGGEVSRIVERRSEPPTSHKRANGVIGAAVHAPVATGPVRTKAELELLRVIAQPINRGGISRIKLAIWAGYSHRSGSYASAIASLRHQGLITGSGDSITITKAGLDVAPPSDEVPPKGRDLLRWWQNRRPKGEADILQALSGANELPRDELARRANKSAASGSFATALSNLRKLGLIWRRGGGIALSEELR